MSDNIKHDNNSGLLTSIWGSDTWNSLHCITFGYPEHPTEEDKEHYKLFFETLRFVLPCCACRKHFTEHTKPGAKFEITYDVLKNRTTLTKWLYELHNYVDKTLEMNYDITYNDVCEKYSSYIANCVMSMDKKIIAYKNDHNREAPYVTYSIAVCFADYAKQRGIENYLETLDNTYNAFSNKRSVQKEFWIERNINCWKTINYMRTNGILGFEQNGEFKNLPSIEELKLLQLMCTTMKESSLKHMLEKLGFKFVEVATLTS